MGSSKASDESEHEFIVKEEFVFENVTYTDNIPVLEKEQDSSSHNTKTKCGEVMLDYHRDFTLVCAMCSSCFTDFYTFGTHILKVHLKHAEDIAITVPKEEDEDQTQPMETLDINESIIQDTANIYLDEEVDSAKEDDKIEIEKGMDPVKEVKVVNPPSESESDNTEGSDDDGDTTSQPAMKNPFFCPVCGRSYKYNRTLRDHVRTNHADMFQEKIDPDSGNEPSLEVIPKLPKVTCRYCNEQFRRLDKFCHHLVVHPVPYRYKCLHCPKTFATSTMRTLHQNIHEGLRPYKCSHCPKAFANPTNLMHHERIHLKIYNYACQFCGKTFIQKSDKVTHERIHTKEMPYQCEECGQKFICQGKLTAHTRRHKNIKNYKCEYCEKAFYNSGTLKNHLVVHTKERRYSCNICNKKFTRGFSLKEHKRLHSEVKKYICKVCGKDFTQFPGLYSHMKSHREVGPESDSKFAAHQTCPRYN